MTMHDAIRRLCVIAAIVLASAVSLNVDPPDLEINTLAGVVETVDATWSGTNYNVRWTQATITGQQVDSTILTTNVANDVDPRIAVAPTGNVLVIWWRDLSTDGVVYRKRNLVSGAWGVERAVGAAYESNSHPRVVYAGDKAWVAYQIQNARSRSIGCQIIDDDPEPFRSIVATTSSTGELDVRIDAESRHLWVTWIDAGSRVGYTEYRYDKQYWSVPAFEPYGADSVAAARSRIRQRVLGL
jgi:hypothetical protein